MRFPLSLLALTASAVMPGMLLGQATSRTPQKIVRARIQPIDDRLLRDSVLPIPLPLTSVSALYNQMKGTPKSEFESIEVYKARLQSEMPRLATVTYAIIPDEQPEFSYDAEKGAFEAVLHVAHTSIGVGKNDVPYRDTWALVLSSSNLSIRKYVGVNGFGASTVVTKQRDKYFVVWNDSIGLLTNAHHLTVPLPSSVAQLVKPNLRVVYMVTPSPSSDGWVTAVGYNHTEPTIQYPYEFTTDSYGMWSSSLQVVVYDVKTGVVYFRKIIHE